ncbi:MAG: SGNH/GDSL hydrolase family protein [Chloroflexi bacterium]|nr:SGNH/GDSL hydrolase family protein [Chloroflexota bacterium]
MRIAFLGASLTEGKYGGDWVAAARPHLPGHTLLNHGVAGNTVNRLVERVGYVAADDAEACFVLAGSNDALAYAFPATRPYYKSQQGLPDGYLEPDDYAAYLRDLLNQLALNHIHALVGLPPMEYSPEAVEASALFNRHTREVAESLNVPVLDIAAALNPPHVPKRPPLTLQTVFRIGERIQSGWNDFDSERAAGGYTYSFDGIHITPAAAGDLGWRVADWLREQLDL